MRSALFFLMLLSVFLISWIKPSFTACNPSGCKEDTMIKFFGPVAGPDYYIPPGPITLTCNVSGNLQHVDWERKDNDGLIHILNSKTLRNFSSYWIATIDNYLLKEKFPFSYLCVPVDSCCRKKVSQTKTLKFRSIRSLPGSCIKDVLVILDTSGSISRVDVYTKFIPFLQRLVDDPRLVVSQEGSHIAIISFSENSLTRLSFSKGHDKNVVLQTIDKADSWFIPGGRTKTWKAFELANQIFAAASPSNHRPDIDDVIVFITDGLPTQMSSSRSKGIVPSRLLASRLKQKGVRIVGISYSDENEDVTNFVKDISTPGEALETSLDDIEMIVDRVVYGFCPQTVPGKPQNVSIAVNENSIIVSWPTPIALNENVDYYIISWRKANGTFLVKHVNATSSPFVITNLDNFGSYTIKIQAGNYVGISKAVYFNNTFICNNTTTTPNTVMKSLTTKGRKSAANSTVAIAGGVTGSVVFLLAIVALLYLQKQIRIKRREESVKKFETWHEDNEMISIAPTSTLVEREPLNRNQYLKNEEISYIVLLKDWEISPCDLKVQEKILGAGQFGIVKQGQYKPSKNCDPEIVAVKTLKDNARESDLSDLLAELETLKKINSQPHPNVIRFIGGCTVEGKLLVVTEFCPGGNLQSFLRKSRISSNTDSEPNYVNITSTLNDRELLKLAVDIANGMVHLSAQKFVHRDLAARNILLAEGNVAKVSDFGLARDIESAEEYIRSTQNLLPVKWMALESLLHGRFTTASDVWSFGVLLYEIATLGEEPYKNLSPYSIISHVGCGCRMPKPSHCSSELYEIMTKCWKVDPQQRPTFSEIWQELHDMLNDNKTSYINVVQVEKKVHKTTTPTDLKMTKKDPTV